MAAHGEYAFTNGLSAAEESKVLELARAVEPAVRGKPHHEAFCSRGTYVRYLRARTWHVDKASKMLHATLTWRDQYRPDAMRWEEVRASLGRGKLQLLRPDRDGRPTVLMRPRLEQVSDHEAQIRYLIYVLERASQIADSTAHGKMTWLIDFVGYSHKNSPPLRVSLQTLHILQDHYPERLGRAVCFRPPMLFEILWRAVNPFIDPNTRNKLIFIGKKDGAKEVVKYFHPEGVDDTLGGLIPIDSLLDMSSYERRMKELDAEADKVTSLHAST